MAVAIILCARKGVRISPIWNPELQKMTGKTLPEIEPVFKKIFQFYRKSFPNQVQSRPQTSWVQNRKSSADKKLSEKKDRSRACSLTKPKYQPNAPKQSTLKSRKGSVRPTRMNIARHSSQSSISRTNQRSSSKTIATPDKPLNIQSHSTLGRPTFSSARRAE